MSGAFRLAVKSGEKLYLNGAVIAPDRKVTLEFLNDATFLLEGHVLQAEDANTPLRQLYFAMQTMLIDPAAHGASWTLSRQMLTSLIGAFDNRQVLEGLKHVEELLVLDRVFEALKTVRTLYPLESGILRRQPENHSLTAKWQQEKPSWT